MDRMCSLQKAEMNELEEICALPCTGDAGARRNLYECAAGEKRLHVLRVNGEEAVVGAVAISHEENAQSARAMRLEGMAVSAGVHGAYEAMISACELIAMLRGQSVMVIACPAEDEKLMAFCTRQGFAETGTCDGVKRFERGIEQGCHCGG